MDLYPDNSLIIVEPLHYSIKGSVYFLKLTK